jgi:hypothetical protein
MASFCQFCHLLDSTERTNPPELSAPRGPFLWEKDMTDTEPGEIIPNRIPDYEFDQRINWQQNYLYTGYNPSPQSF